MALRRNIYDRGTIDPADMKSRLSEKPRNEPLQVSTAPGQTALRQDLLLLEEENRQLREKVEQGGALEIPIDYLDEVPGRRRQLSESEYDELKANLRTHPLITPITVRRSARGRYEIVSGHNRVAIYKELRDEVPDQFHTIRAWLSEDDENRTEELAFYANLFHPDLSAYEKYVGLKKVMGSLEVASQDLVAERTGLSKQAVSDLLTFDKLPPAALKVLAQKPSAIGYKTAVRLAAITEGGGSERVIAAVEAAVEKDLAQQEVVLLAESKPKITTERPRPQTFKAGKRNYCAMLGVKKTLRLEFQSEDERAEFESRVRDLVIQMAAEKKESKE